MSAPHDPELLCGVADALPLTKKNWRQRCSAPNFNRIATNSAASHDDEGVEPSPVTGSDPRYSNYYLM